MDPIDTRVLGRRDRSRGNERKLDGVVIRFPVSPAQTVCLAGVETAGTVNLWMITVTKGIFRVIPVLNKMRWTKGPLESWIRSTSS
jgi:hypothetical protein